MELSSIEESKILLYAIFNKSNIAEEYLKCKKFEKAIAFFGK